MNQGLMYRLHNLAGKSLRHDSHERFILVAAWIDQKSQIIRHKVNRQFALNDVARLAPPYGFHAEELAMRCIKRTNILAVARFNMADLTADRFKPLMARPCIMCREMCAHIPRIYFTDSSGEWNILQ